MKDLTESSVVTINETIFDDLVTEEELLIQIDATEYDFQIFKTRLAGYRRKLTGDVSSWSAVYRPGVESDDKENLGDWLVTYTVKVIS